MGCALFECVCVCVCGGWGDGRGVGGCMHAGVLCFVFIRGLDGRQENACLPTHPHTHTHTYPHPHTHIHIHTNTHSALGTAAAAAGLAASGGARYAAGGPFFPESLTTGPIPTAVRERGMSDRVCVFCG